jgi:hypothetical protein
MRRFDAAGIQKGNNPGLYLFPAAAGRPMIAAPGDGLATWHGAANRWRVWARFGCLPPEIFFFIVRQFGAAVSKHQAHSLWIALKRC